MGKGENESYLFSSNNFVGRQTWVFKANEGTHQEQAQIEEARLSYYQNRLNVPCSSDFLWQFQVLHLFSLLYKINLIAAVVTQKSKQLRNLV